MRKGKTMKMFLAVLVLAAALLPMPVLADTGDVASAGEIANAREIGKYGMLPVYGQDIADGTYHVTSQSSSAFFRITDAQMTAEDGELSVTITLSSHSYLYVYPGTAEEAAAADTSAYIPFVDDADGRATFTFPLKAMDTQVRCAAYSKNTEKWYDRLLLFEASSLPREALYVDLPNYDLIEKGLEALGDTGFDVDTAVNEGWESEEKTLESAAYEPAEALSVDLPDGEYSIEVNMTGGSGRASVSSPTLLLVQEGKAYAKLFWSSTYYDYMIVGGMRYENRTTDGGNSTFIIPISAMDSVIPIIADTTAMGDPLEIEYTLTFYRESIGDKGMIPQEAAKKVLVIALFIIIGGGILNWYVKRGRR